MGFNSAFKGLNPNYIWYTPTPSFWIYERIRHDFDTW